MTTAVAERVQERHSKVVHGFLVALLGVVLGVTVLSLAFLGADTLAELAPNLLFLVMIGLSIYLNRRGRFRLAVGLLTILLTLVASLTPLASGLEGTAVSLYIFFIPLGLAGFLLHRRALFAIAAWSLVVVIASPILHGVPLLADDGLTQPWMAALQFGAVFSVMTLFLDRFSVAFRATLGNAIEQEVALKEEAQERLRTYEELIEERRVNETVMEHLPGIFFVVDGRGRYLRWNRNFADWLGYSEEELEAMLPPDFFDAEDVPRLQRTIEQIFRDGAATMEAEVVAKNGVRHPYFFSGTRVRMGGEDYIAGIGIDRTEIDAARTQIDQLNQDLTERLERITALHEIDKAITGSYDLERTLDVVLEQVTERLSVDAAAILLLQAGAQSLRFGASRGFKDPNSLEGMQLRIGEGLAGKVALERERMVLNEPDTVLEAFAASPRLREEGFRSYAAVPLVSKGKLQGVLELFHHEPLRLDDDWLDFFTALSLQAAVAIDDSRLFTDLQRSNTELRLAYDTTIEGWARALDLRDEETEGHSRRVTDLTVQLAESMGVDEDQLVHIRRGALLHDIGKMGVPDSILLKPGKLTTEEWSIMQRHTVYALDLLMPIEFLRPALDIPYYHHEKWDGTGYPQGLKGEEIPVAARIFAVIDVFDALTSDRVYRKAWGKDRAVEYIRAQSGEHFDPDVVEAFLRLVGASGRRAAGSAPDAYR